MGLIILFAVMTIISVIGLTNKKFSQSDWCPAFCVPGLVIGAAGFIVGTVVAIDEHSTYSFNETYTLTMDMIEMYDSSPDNRTFNIAKQINKNVESINSRIRSHRKNAGSFWLGAYSCEEIANRDYIEIQDLLSPEIKVKDNHDKQQE